MVDKSALATISAFGVPGDILTQEIDIDELKGLVSEDQEGKIDSAIEEKFYVYPRTKGLYQVWSVKDGQDRDIYTVNLNGSEFACECNDYIYRCAPQKIYCKHIWRVLLLIKINALPGKNDDPYSWIINELYSDIDWLEESFDKDMESRVNQLREIEEDLMETRRPNTNYKKIFEERARIMMHPV